MGNNIPETNQWKLNGDCSKCRRQEFCRKRCAAFKNDMQRSVRNFTKSYLHQITPVGNFRDNLEKWI